MESRRRTRPNRKPAGPPRLGIISVVTAALGAIASAVSVTVADSLAAEFADRAGESGETSVSIAEVFENHGSEAAIIGGTFAIGFLLGITGLIFGVLSLRKNEGVLGWLGLMASLGVFAFIVISRLS